MGELAYLCDRIIGFTMRKLTDYEIDLLEGQGCTAEDWTAVEVDNEGFRTDRVRNVCFCGQVSLGSLDGEVEVEEGFCRAAGLYDVTLHNVSVGSGCLITKVGTYISNCDIADGVYIANTSLITTTGTTTFGCGTEVAVLNEGGDANVVLSESLTAQTAHLQVWYPSVRRLAQREAEQKPRAERGRIGSGTRIVGAGEIANTSIGESCDIQGAVRISEATIMSSDEAPVLIGPGVIINNSIVAAGATVTDAARINNSFVGESSHVGNGFSSESSLFFANCHMDNGEACAAFCGPFSCSHHKSTLLIGGQISFYNAGSATNQSNHAYKMGPIHYGTLARGSKTASGAHILWPAQIGAFSMVMGKITSHPDLTALPFSYVIAQPDGTTAVVPGINIRTVGTWRDAGKWPKRDLRPRQGRRDIINFAFPDPSTVQQVLEGRKLLARLTAAPAEYYEYKGCHIKHSAAVKGIQYYDLALRLFIYNVLNTSHDTDAQAGADRWTDLCGMPAPVGEVERIVSDVETGAIDSTDELLVVLRQVNADYRPNAADYARHLMQQIDNTMFVDMDRWLSEAEEAHAQWLQLIRRDAEHEYQLGDVDEDFLREFIGKIK